MSTLPTVVTEALQKSLTTSTAELYAPEVINVAVVAFRDEPAAYQQARETIRNSVKRGASIAKEWDQAVKREHRKRLQEDRRLERSETVHAYGSVSEDDMTAELPDMRAYDFGIKEYSKDPTASKCAQLFRLMNEEFTFVTVGGQPKYVSIDPKTGSVEYHSAAALTQRFETVQVPDVCRNQPHRTVSAFTAWCAWPSRATNSGIGFYPGSPANPADIPAGHLNIWRGARIEPKQGSWSRLKHHLREVICGGNQAHYDYLLDWFAHLIQSPQSKPGCAVVLRSDKEGTGKSMIVETLLTRIFGSQTVRTVDDMDELTRNFNSQMETTLVLGLDEALFAGSAKQRNSIYHSISADTIDIERKGVDKYRAKSYCRFILTANAKWVVPAGVHSRRFFVLDVQNSRANDRSYFEPLFTEIREEGGAEAFYFDMLARKITSDLYNPPETKALLQQRKHSLEPLHKWAHQVAQSGIIHLDNGNVVEISAGRKVDTEELRKSILSHIKVHPNDVGSFGMELGSLLKGQLGCERRRYSRGYHYVFPSRAVFVAAVQRVTRVPVKTYEDDEDTSQLNLPDSRRAQIDRMVERSERFHKALGTYTPSHEAGHA
ncbi:MAG: primase-helicase family protein [Hyphomicrobiaceae bacterium]